MTVDKRLFVRQTSGQSHLQTAQQPFSLLQGHSRKKNFKKNLPPHFLRLEGAVWLTPIAIISFAARAETKSKQTKSLQSPPHVGFCKAIKAIPKQSTFIFAKRQAKINKLCCSRTTIRCPPLGRSIYASLPLAT